MKKIAGVKSVRLAARSPNLNAFAERIVRTIKKECLSRMVQIAEGSLQAVIGQFFEYSHGERSHQELENGIINPEFTTPTEGCVNRMRF